MIPIPQKSVDRGVVMTIGKARFLPTTLAFVALAAGAGQGIHIDASSDAAAERSLQRMLTSLDGSKKTQLSDAVVQLDGGKSGSKPMAAPIKNKIGGLTAQEIIDLAHSEAGGGTAK
jgi:hypothetical protein